MDKSSDYNEDYVSIVVPWFNRPYYVEGLIESVHKYADFPFELVIHDDSSTDGADEELLKFRDKISTLILNSGRQFGLSQSLNRVISSATSNYIIQINSDVVLVNSCYQDIRNILSKKYVGYVDLDSSFSGVGRHIVSNGTKFKLKPGIGAGCAFAFRKDFWNEVGGFSNYIHSGCADTPLMYKAWMNGYFRAQLFSNEKFIRNLSNEKGTADSQIGKAFCDCGYTRIFNVENYDKLCNEREHYCKNVHWKKGVDKKKGLWDLDYWHNYSSQVVNDNIEFNWKVAERYGQSKWKDIIEKDIIKGD